MSKRSEPTSGANSNEYSVVKNQKLDTFAFRFSPFNSYYESISIIDSLRIVLIVCYFFNSESDRRGVKLTTKKNSIC